MIIAISGVDGSGKSSLVNNLMTYYKKKGTPTIKFYLGEYLVIKYIVALLHKTKIGSHEKEQTKHNPFLTTNNKPLLIQIWTLITILDNFLRYVQLKYYSIRGYYVICDRYFYDKLVGFKYHGYTNNHFSNIYIKLTPNPDIQVILNISPELSQKRESNGNHTIEFYKEIQTLNISIHRKTISTTISVDKLNEKEVLDYTIEIIENASI